ITTSRRSWTLSGNDSGGSQRRKSESSQAKEGIMAVTLTGTNGLFTRIGRIGGWVNSILNAQGAAALTAPSVSAGVAYTNLLAQFTSGASQADLFDSFVSSVLNPYRLKSATISHLKAF